MLSRLGRRALPGLAATIPFAFVGSAFAQDSLVVTDLELPRGLFAHFDDVVIAEMGAGKILRLGADGFPVEVVTTIGAAVVEAPDGPQAAGISAVTIVDDLFYFVSGIPGQMGVHEVSAGGTSRLIADLEAYELANNPDGDVLEDGSPHYESNPYDIVANEAGDLFVSDAAGNVVYRVTTRGDITVFAVFPNRANPLFPDLGGPVMDQVPTGLAIGPDGAVYVGTLTGFPFPAGAALVYRLSDDNGDGDATDEGETTVVAEGLSTVTDVAFDGDGNLLVAEFSVSMLENAPGRVVRVADDGAIAEVASPLVSPTGIAVLPNGTIVVAQEFLGIVAEVNAAAAIAASPPPDAE